MVAPKQSFLDLPLPSCTWGLSVLCWDSLLGRNLLFCGHGKVEGYWNLGQRDESTIPITQPLKYPNILSFFKVRKHKNHHLCTNQVTYTHIKQDKTGMKDPHYFITGLRSFKSQSWHVRITHLHDHILIEERSFVQMCPKLSFLCFPEISVIIFFFFLSALPS